MTRSFFADDPITDDDQDILSRRAFAERVAALCSHAGADGASSVIALVGAWGSGKSSVLNLTVAELQHEGGPTVVEFNPWLLSDIDSLLAGFLTTLNSALPTTRGDKIREKLSGYARALTPWAKMVGVAGLDASAVLEAFGREDSIDQRRKDLEAELRDLETTVLVVMDDLDRLQPPELLLVFKLIRLVGRLPHVSYLLAYDEHTVIDLLTHTDLADNRQDRARAYLEKIVQLRLELPPLHHDDQARLIDTGITGLLREFDVTLSLEDTSRLKHAYQACLRHHLTQPRAINRFLADIRAVYPLVGNEVNLTDLILLSFLRTVEPAVYHLLRTHRDELTDLSQRPAGETPEQHREHWITLLDPHDTRPALTRHLLALLAELFTPIQSALDHMVHHPDTARYAALGRGRRVAHPDYFDRYFQFGIPTSDIPDTVVSRALEQLNTGGPDLDTLSARITTHSAAATTLRKIQRLVEDGGPTDPHALIVFLAAHYDTLTQQAYRQVFNCPDWQLVDITAEVMSRQPDTAATATIDDLLTAGRLLFVVELVGALPKHTIADSPVIIQARAALTRALATHFDTLGHGLVSAIPPGHIHLLSTWRRLEHDPAPIRDLLWRNIDQGWSPLELISALVPEQPALGRRGTRIALGQIDTALWDDILGLDRLATELGTLIEQAPDLATFDLEVLISTPSNRERYALSTLKHHIHRATAQHPGPH